MTRKFLKPIALTLLVAAVSLEFYFLLSAPPLNPYDVIPQPLSPLPLRPPVMGEEAWYLQGRLPRSMQEEFEGGVVDKTSFPYYENGEIHPPKKYDVANNYSANDIEKMKAALKVARRYADINKALQDGYRIEDNGFFVAGMGTHVINIDYMVDDEVSVERPEFLTYVKNRENGRFQLTQMGFLAQRDTPYPLFEAKEAQGHFHVGAFCVLADDVYVRYPSYAIRDRHGSNIPPHLALESGIFDEIEPSDLTVPADACKEFPRAKVVGPSTWMMHFAVNMYNKHGMFADYFAYVNYLSANAVSHSFFGKSI